MRKLSKASLACVLALSSVALFAGPQKKNADGNGGKGTGTGASGPAAGGGKSIAQTDDPAYIIGAEDMLDVTVWKEPDVSRLVPVRPDGRISLPLLNDIQAAGLTPMQLQARIAVGLKRFMETPQVTVIVTQINSRRVYILGEVNRPGALPILPNMTILQALSAAGGLNQFAKSTGVYLIRNENGKQVSYPFNYKEVVRGIKPEQNIELKPGDTLVVP